MRRSTANEDIKVMLMQKGIFYWQIASVLGVHENTITRWMRTELPDEQKMRITQAVYKIINSREEV